MYKDCNEGLLLVFVGVFWPVLACVSGIQLNKVDNSLTLAPSLFLMWFLRLILILTDGHKHCSFTCYYVLSDQGGKLCPRFISMQQKVEDLLCARHCARHSGQRDE